MSNRVMKASAKGIIPGQSATIVAIKMLKGTYTVSLILFVKGKVVNYRISPTDVSIWKRGHIFVG